MNVPADALDSPPALLREFPRAIPVVAPVDLMEDRKIGPPGQGDRPGKIQRRQRDPLKTQFDLGHAEEARKRHLHTAAGFGVPDIFAPQLAGPEIQFAAEIGKAAEVQVQDFVPHRDPGVQPVRRVHQEANSVRYSLVDGGFREVVFLENSVEVASDQMIARIPLVEISTDPHVLVGKRKQRFGHAAFIRVKSLFDDFPGVNR